MARSNALELHEQGFRWPPEVEAEVTRLVGAVEAAEVAVKTVEAARTPGEVSDRRALQKAHKDVGRAKDALVDALERIEVEKPAWIEAWKAERVSAADRAETAELKARIEELRASLT